MKSVLYKGIRLMQGSQCYELHQEGKFKELDKLLKKLDEDLKKLMEG